jgi:sRNA-binding protein
MKRSELTVGMEVAVKHGYGDGYRATVVSLDKHTKGHSGRTITGRGTGLLVRFADGYRKGQEFVAQPQAVLGEWAAYQAQQQAQEEARKENAATAAERKQAAERAEEHAVEAAAKIGLPVRRKYSSYTGQVVLDAAQFETLLAALPEGYVFPKGE